MSPKTGAWRLPITILIQVLSLWPYYCHAEILPNSDYRPPVAKQIRPKETAQPPHTQYFSRHAYNHTFSERKYIHIYYPPSKGSLLSNNHKIRIFQQIQKNTLILSP